MSEICAALGRKLTRARRKKKLSLPDVADELCISVYQLKALESGLFDDLPGAVYVYGFLRNYAELVDLDADELVEMARECLSLDGEAKSPHIPEPHYESRFPTKLVLIAATSAMLVFFVGWPQVGEEESPMVPELPPHLADRLGAAVDTPPAGTENDFFLGLREEPATAEPEELATEADELEAAAPGLDPPVEEAAAALEIRATGDTWVEIKNEEDQTLLSGVIHSGDSFIPERTDRLRLTAEDGGNLVLYVRGRAVSELGRPGRRLRSMRLDVADILEAIS